MKWSTAAAIGIFVGSAGLFAYSVMITNNNLDLNGPEIQMSQDVIEMSIKDDDSVILAGITATDSRDGDVTDSLVVESISNFITLGVRKANIVAFDNDNHIARTSREIHYTDYTSPRFSLEEPLRFNMNEGDLVSHLTVKDCIDGDISNKIHMTYTEEYEYGQEQVKATFSVANSMGDSVSLPVTIDFYESALESARPDVELSDYLIYVSAKKAKKIDPMKYLKSISMYGKNFKNRDGKMVRSGSSSEEPEYLDSDLLKIENPVSETPGTYEIAYTVKDPRDPEDNTDDTEITIRLIVVVTEE